jgi:hypothetical protein
VPRKLPRSCGDRLLYRSRETREAISLGVAQRRRRTTRGTSCAEHLHEVRLLFFIARKFSPPLPRAYIIFVAGAAGSKAHGVRRLGDGVEAVRLTRALTRIGRRNDALSNEAESSGFATTAA